MTTSDAPSIRLLHTSPTPVHRLPRLGTILGVDLWVKREDLHPSYAGGNKARKVDRLLPRLERRGHDALVTTGSTFSNHARAVALAASQRGWACDLVLHGDRQDLTSTVNGRLLDNSGARLRFVRPEGIAAELARADRELRDAGFNPAVVDGGGHGIDGTLAYVDALHELDGQRGHRSARGPVAIVAPVGTGSTHAGLHVAAEGLAGYRVIGVSIARPRDRATAVAGAACAQARAYLGQRLPTRPVEIHDDWLEGGYAVTSPRVDATVRMALREEGLVLDPTYSGKTLLGLVQLVERGDIARGSEVWLVHTGGWSTLGAASRASAADLTTPGTITTGSDSRV